MICNELMMAKIVALPLWF
jgi:hypothetical protein